MGLGVGFAVGFAVALGVAVGFLVAGTFVTFGWTGRSVAVTPGCWVAWAVADAVLLLLGR